MRKSVVTAAASVLAVLGMVVPANSANAADVHVSRHVRHMRHVLHTLTVNPPKHLPKCVEEDGSGQWACVWNGNVDGNGVGDSYSARVSKVYDNGDVQRRYRYSDGHIEYIREGF